MTNQKPLYLFQYKGSMDIANKDLWSADIDKKEIDPVNIKSMSLNTQGGTIEICENPKEADNGTDPVVDQEGKVYNYATYWLGDQFYCAFAEFTGHSGGISYYNLTVDSFTTAFNNGCMNTLAYCLYSTAGDGLRLDPRSPLSYNQTRYRQNLSTFNDELYIINVCSGAISAQPQSKSSQLRNIDSYMMTTSEFRQAFNDLYNIMLLDNNSYRRTYLNSIISVYVLPFPSGNINYMSFDEAETFKLYQNADADEKGRPLTTETNKGAPYRIATGTTAPLKITIPEINITTPMTAPIYNAEMIAHFGMYGDIKFAFADFAGPSKIGANVYIDLSGAMYKTVLVVDGLERPTYMTAGSITSTVPLLSASNITNWSLLRTATNWQVGLGGGAAIAGGIMSGIVSGSMLPGVGNVAGGVVGGVTGAMQAVNGGISAALNVDSLHTQQLNSLHIKGNAGTSMGFIDNTCFIEGLYHKYLNHEHALWFGYPDGSQRRLTELTGYIQTIGAKLANPKGLPQSIIATSENLLNAGCYLT